jgi:hypothetical protein
MLQVFTAYVECRHPSASVLIPALRTVGNIVTGDDLQTQVKLNDESIFLMYFFFVLVCVLLLNECVFSAACCAGKNFYICQAQ